MPNKIVMIQNLNTPPQFAAGWGELDKINQANGHYTRFNPIISNARVFCSEIEKIHISTVDLFEDGAADSEDVNRAWCAVEIAQAALADLYDLIYPKEVN